MGRGRGKSKCKGKSFERGGRKGNTQRSQRKECLRKPVRYARSLVLHAGIKRLQAAEGVFGRGAVGLFDGVVPAGVVALRVGLDGDAITAGDEDEVLVIKVVADLRLRDQPADLAANGDDGFIRKQLASGVAGAVDDDRLRECGEILWRMEFTGFDLATGSEEFIEQLAGVVSDIEDELRSTVDRSGGKGRERGIDVRPAGKVVMDAIVEGCKDVVRARLGRLGLLRSFEVAELVG